jgi:hypothetical protein
MDPKKTGREKVDWIHQERAQWWDFVNMVTAFLRRLIS